MRAFLVVACVLAAPLGLSAAGRWAPFEGVSLEAMRSAAPLEFRPVGSTSVVFRTRLEGGEKIAFRPSQRGRPRGHLAELAAYRIGAALGMESVPPVVLRREPLHRIDRLLDRRFRTKHQELRPKIRAPAGWVTGAAIHWIDDLTHSRLDKPEVREIWLGALAVGGDTGELSPRLLRDLARLVAFDFLIGNWDRMSGFNLQTDPSGERIYVRDHNLAFDAPLRPRHESKLVERLRKVERFSRGFVARLRALDRSSLEAALAPDPVDPDRPILTEDQLGGVLERRREILRHVDGLVARHGEATVLAFE